MLIIDDGVLTCAEEVLMNVTGTSITTQDTGRMVWLVTHCCGQVTPLLETRCEGCGMLMEDEE